ncbi:MAG TPA: rhomboid family intramembrane serine protease [Gemmatimonadales bacterium]|nr:rhomboid family intramembrane serine protease [Gemmatimonadales bacterium]
MLPIRDENPTVHTPVITYAIIAVNLAVWVFIQGMGAEPTLSNSVCTLGLIPGELLGRLPSGMEVPVGPGTSCMVGGPNLLAPLTSMFTHGSWLHVLGNMWFLHVFGNNVEDAMGKVRFLAFYLLSGLAAATAQVLSAPGSEIPMIGASGAIGGVMGGYVLLYPRAGIQTFVFLGIWARMLVLPAFVMLGYWFVLQLLSGALAPTEGGGVAFWAHVGGFLAGLALTPLFTNRRLLAEHRAAVGD